MEKSFSNTMRGKIVIRTVLIAFVVALVLGGIAIMSLRSLTSTANDAIAASQGMSAEAAAPLQDLANDISSSSSSTVTLMALLALVAILGAGALAYIFGGKIAAPITQLRNVAMQSATTLPDILSGESDEAIELPSLVVSSGDEVQDISLAFDHVQRMTVDIASQQSGTHIQPQAEIESEVRAELEQEMQARFDTELQQRMDEFAVEHDTSGAPATQSSEGHFVNLGRRNQSLLARQMNFIDSMEKDETNPANLKRLFQIDHLATRMRRNAESILVLAGEGSERQLRRPIPMHQVVQAASGEIEHFERVAFGNMVDAAVDGSVAPDLAHLLAELLENATTFAPAQANARVDGRPTEHGYLIEVIDRGDGLDEATMAAMNTRLASAHGASDDPDQLGHGVVARLAHRHGFGVEMAPTVGGGLTARIHLPLDVMATLDAPATPTVTRHERVPATVPAAINGSSPSPVEDLPAPPAMPAIEDLPARPVAEELVDLPAPPMPVAEEFAAAEDLPAPPAMPAIEDLPARPVAEELVDLPAPPMPVAEEFAAAEDLPARPIAEESVAEEFAVAEDLPAPPMPMAENAIAKEIVVEDLAAPRRAFGDAIETEFFDDATVTSVEDHADTTISSDLEQLLDNSEAPDYPVMEDATVSSLDEHVDTTVTAGVEDLGLDIDEITPASDIAESTEASAETSDSEQVWTSGLDLSPEELEAIEWAMEASDAGTSASVVAGLTGKVATVDADASPLAAVGVASELRPGPLDAEALAELRRSQQGRKNA